MAVEPIRSDAQLDELLTRPSEALVASVAELDGDWLIVGASGKVGPTLVRMLRRAIDQAGVTRRIIAVARRALQGQAFEGVETRSVDLLDIEAVRSLPRVRNVVYLVGRKFGSAGNEPLTWATNVLAPSLLGEVLQDSRVAMFSTGCVYPLMHVDSGGATEQTPMAPVGEYAMSCVARERVFDAMSTVWGVPVVQIRLNYAVELRYGVIVDIARRIAADEPVDLTTGYVNVIWQGDACDWALRSLSLASSPSSVVNVTGSEMLSVRSIAERLAERMGQSVR